MTKIEALPLPGHYVSWAPPEGCYEFKAALVTALLSTIDDHIRKAHILNPKMQRDYILEALAGTIALQISELEDPLSWQRMWLHLRDKVEKTFVNMVENS